MLALLLPDQDVAARPIVVDPASLLETPEPFRCWLAAQPATALVGRAESLFSCPIANFLTAEGVFDPVVGPHVIRWDWHTNADLAPRYDPPAWVIDFICKLDRYYAGLDVPAVHARMVLAEVAP